MAAYRGLLIQLVHLVARLPRERWLEYNAEPGLIGFLIIYLIHGIQGYGRGLPILILYFFFYRKMGLSSIKRYTKIKEILTLVIIIDERFPLLQGDNSRDEVVVVRKRVKR